MEHVMRFFVPEGLDDETELEIGRSAGRPHRAAV
jgi:hypothetical protein